MLSHMPTMSRPKRKRLYRCYVCKRFQVASKFRACPTRSTGIRSSCLNCEPIEYAAYESRRKSEGRKRGPGGTSTGRHAKIHAERRAHSYWLWYSYRISVAEYDAMLDAQNGVCAICEGPPNGSGSKNGRFHVDHNERTGQVRGLLCGNCNHGLGKFCDDPKRLRRAAKYLERTSL